MITIKPCPFCGHDDVEIDEVSLSEFAVCCPECRAIGSIMGTVMDAISFWNDRRGQVDNAQAVGLDAAGGQSHTSAVLEG